MSSHLDTFAPIMTRFYATPCWQLACVALLFWTTALPAAAQTWPSKPVRIIVPYGAGGGTDILGRRLAQKLTESLGQTVLVDNRAGADGLIGTEATARTAADGYTMVFVSSGHGINPAIYAKVNFNTTQDLSCISYTANQHLVLVVHRSTPVNNVIELVKYAKANPGKVNFASTSPTTRLPMELLNGMAGIQINDVPYKGSGPAMGDILGGHVQGGFVGMAAAMPHIKAGTLRVLGLGDNRRSTLMPDLATIAEAGFPEFRAVAWTALLVPASTPRPIVKRVNDELKKIMAAPDFKIMMEGQGFELVGSAPEECDRFIASEITKWTKVVKDAGIKPM